MTWLPRSPGSNLVLWLNQETAHRLHLAVLATMQPALDPAGHRVLRTKPTCLLHTWKPRRLPPFALVLHLHQHQSSRNLHLQYLAKNRFTQRCQSLITQGSDHPPVLEPHMVLTIIWGWINNSRKIARRCHDLKYLSKGKVFPVPTLFITSLPEDEQRLSMGEVVGTM
jgi:hypothetical protein